MKNWSDLDKDMWGNFNNEGGIIGNYNLLSGEKQLKIIGHMMISLASKFKHYFTVHAIVNADGWLRIQLMPKSDCSYANAIAHFRDAKLYVEGLNEGATL
jgi:hypothetical protein